MNSPSISPEATLLLACINVSSTPAEKSARIDQLLRQPLNWDNFIRLVMTHGMASITCAHLKSKVCPGGVPAGIYAGLRYWDASNLKSTDQIADELTVIMSRFESANIPAIALKGPALSRLAYGSVSARNSGDLDILVRPVDVTAAAELLISVGFRSRTYKREVFTSGFFRSTSDDFSSESAKASIDLHWRIREHYFPFGPDEDALWHRTEGVLLKGREVRTLGAGDHLLYLCAHASKHGWRNLIAVTDIAALITTRPDMDLCLLIEEATRLRFRRMVLLGLSLAHRVAGAQMKEETVTIVQRDTSACSLSDKILARFVTQSYTQSVFDRWRAAASTVESGPSKIRMFATHSLTPIADDYARFALPPALYPLYYLMRPLRLAGGAALMITRRTKVHESDLRDGEPRR